MGFQKPTFLGPDFGGGENTVGYFIPSVDEPLPPALRHAPRFPAGRGGGLVEIRISPPPQWGPGPYSQVITHLNTPGSQLHAAWKAHGAGEWGGRPNMLYIHKYN